jgi:hypothetical protein
VGGFRRAGRWFSFSGFVVAGALFALPFVTVSCEAPGGYGRAEAGATTDYTGFDLALGDEPSVDGTERPPSEQQPDRLPVQPVAVLALLAVAAGAAVVGLVRAVRVRRLAAAGTAFVAAALVGSALLAAQSIVESRLREQLTVDMPAGRTAGDFVAMGGGGWLCIVTLGILTAGNLAGWVLARRGAGLVEGASSVVGPPRDAARARRKKPARPV